MKTLKEKEIKTITIDAKGWHDKVNGNSYFSSKIFINRGLPNEVILKIPFSFGYGSQFRYNSFDKIKKEFGIFSEYCSLHVACLNHNIEYTASIEYVKKSRTIKIRS